MPHGLGHIADRQVIPGHVPGPDLVPELCNLQALQFMGFNQCDHGSDAPGRDCIEIDGQVTVPHSRDRIGLLLARAEGQPDLSAHGLAKSRTNLGNLQRMAQAGPAAHHCPALSW